MNGVKQQIETTRNVQKVITTIKKEIATRENSGDVYSTYMSELPNPDPILKKLGKDIEVYEDLMYDSRIMAVVGSRVSAVKKRSWDIIGEDTPQKEIDFYKEVFESYNMDDVINEILDYFWYGYKPMEIIPNTDGALWYPEKFVGKPPEWFTYDNENQLRFLSKHDSINGEIVPENKFIVPRNKATYKNPYGVPVAAACYWPSIFRKKGIASFWVLLEKFGIPYISTKYPMGTKESDITDSVELLTSLVQDGVFATPENWLTEIISANSGQGKSDSMHKVFYDTMNLEIVMAVTGTNLTSEVQGGSFAAATSHMDVREDITDDDAGKVEETMTELIKIFHGLNFSSAHPKFVMVKDEKIDQTRADRDLKIQQGNPNFSFTPRYYEDKFSLEPDHYIISETKETEVKVDK